MRWTDYWSSSRPDVVFGCIPTADDPVEFFSIMRAFDRRVDYPDTSAELAT